MSRPTLRDVAAFAAGFMDGMWSITVVMVIGIMFISILIAMTLVVGAAIKHAGLLATICGVFFLAFAVNHCVEVGLKAVKTFRKMGTTTRSSI